MIKNGSLAGLSIFLMMTYSEAFYQLKATLSEIYGVAEAAAIAHEVMEHITGLDRLGRLTSKDALLNENQIKDWEHIKTELVTGKPMQQALGYSWFIGRKYQVNEHVLIPRPETEELVQWIIDDWQHSIMQFTILDIGTGSGCIPISLAGALPGAIVESCDISDNALIIAKKNAAANGQSVQFFKKDILSSKTWETLPEYDIIVSNPPYIPLSEKATMDANVRDHDPALALFVPDEDPLIFYRAIAQLSIGHLRQGGNIYCEIHQDFGNETMQIFREHGYQTLLRKDIFGNDRMLRIEK